MEQSCKSSHNMDHNGSVREYGKSAANCNFINDYLWKTQDERDITDMYVPMPTLKTKNVCQE